MEFLSQSNFPHLWSLFQAVIGGTRDKCRLALYYYRGEKRVLEIGCSVGNVSKAFVKLSNIKFTGIDIDKNAIQLAQKKFKPLSNFYFTDISLSDLAKTDEKFDYVLFANILHHVDDRTAIKLLQDGQSCLGKNATLVIMEPEKRRDSYNWVFNLIYKLERGKFRRTGDDLTNLVRKSGLHIRNYKEVLVSSDGIPFVKVGRVILIESCCGDIEKKDFIREFV